MPYRGLVGVATRRAVKSAPKLATATSSHRTKHHARRGGKFCVVSAPLSWTEALDGSIPVCVLGEILRHSTPELQSLLPVYAMPRGYCKHCS